eukprot:CAMPEP_0116147624 /NCGR_PEP_ID=MMETSP0329-20121206/17859_1 /TAXON_ID=697910 /ORGANISM="Pseudo-nitzschia arenysensis, Strain B593" /LENGTH=126 /DNA_ID=CAMNT_0003643575 /DNA_START=117 /DNA_END=497 /DNA_ORIENTATION=+
MLFWFPDCEELEESSLTFPPLSTKLIATEEMAPMTPPMDSPRVTATTSVEVVGTVFSTTFVMTATLELATSSSLVPDMPAKLNMIATARKNPAISAFFCLLLAFEAISLPLAGPFEEEHIDLSLFP